MESLKKCTKLKASSLIESVIAMTIISVCIAISISIYTLVLKNSKSLVYYQLKTEKQKILNEAKNNPIIVNETYDFQNFSIDKTIIPHESISELLELSLTSIRKTDTITSVYLIRKND